VPLALPTVLLFETFKFLDTSTQWLLLPLTPAIATEFGPFILGKLLNAKVLSKSVQFNGETKLSIPFGGFYGSANFLRPKDFWYKANIYLTKIYGKLSNANFWTYCNIQIKL
jgi:hypothetical protein